MNEQHMKKAVGLGTTTATNSIQGDSKPPQTTKLANILSHLIGGQSLNRLEAERHHDQVLNTKPDNIISGVIGALPELQAAECFLNRVKAPERGAGHWVGEVGDGA